MQASHVGHLVALQLAAEGLHILMQYSAFLLVYSITDESSLEDMEEEWLRPILEAPREERRVAAVLVGNKCDLTSQRAISRETGERFAAQYSMPFFEASAKVRLNVEEAFHKLLLRANRLQRFGEEHEREAERWKALFVWCALGSSMLPKELVKNIAERIDWLECVPENLDAWKKSARERRRKRCTAQ